MAGLNLSLTAEEREAFIADQRTVRLATVDGEGGPHVIPLWYVWHDGAMYLNSTLENVTVRNMLQTERVAGVVDDGETYDVLRGVTLSGRVARLGAHAPDEVERKWAEKYLGGSAVPFARWRNRVWFRLEPERIASWDFRKIPEARARQGRRS